MALKVPQKKKKRTPIKPPVAKTTTTATTTSARPSEEIKEIKKSVPPPKKRRAIPPPGARKPVPPPAPAKEVKQDEPPKAKIESQARPGTEAPKPAVTSGSERPPAQSRPAGQTAPEQKRLTAEALRQMEYEDRYKLFRSLNRNPEVFTPLLRELPKKMMMRKDEALERKIIGVKPAGKVPKGAAALLYCPYCVDWQVFHAHSWSGYNKCCGCSITSKDFYIGVDNGIFGKE